MSEFQRFADRAANQLRPVRITRRYTMHAEGSVLIEFGNTKVLCTASVEEKVPPHKREIWRRMGDCRVRHAAPAPPTREMTARLQKASKAVARRKFSA